MSRRRPYLVTSALAWTTSALKAWAIWGTTISGRPCRTASRPPFRAAGRRGRGGAPESSLAEGGRRIEKVGIEHEEGGDHVGLFGCVGPRRIVGEPQITTEPHDAPGRHLGVAVSGPCRVRTSVGLDKGRSGSDPTCHGRRTNAQSALRRPLPGRAAPRGRAGGTRPDGAGRAICRAPLAVWDTVSPRWRETGGGGPVRRPPARRRCPRPRPGDRRSGPSPGERGEPGGQTGRVDPAGMHGIAVDASRAPASLPLVREDHLRAAWTRV